MSALCNNARLFQCSNVVGYTNPFERKKVQTETVSAFAGKMCINEKTMKKFTPKTVQLLFSSLP